LATDGSLGQRSSTCQQSSVGKSFDRDVRSPSSGAYRLACKQYPTRGAKSSSGLERANAAGVETGWCRQDHFFPSDTELLFPSDADLPWAHSDPLQSFFWFPSTFKIFNNLGNLLFAQRQPKSAQREGFCHGFATVVHEPSRPTDEGPDGVWILVAHRISDQQKSNLLIRRSPS